MYHFVDLTAMKTLWWEIHPILLNANVSDFLFCVFDCEWQVSMTKPELNIQI